MRKCRRLRKRKSVIPILLSRGCNTVIITLGDKGAVFASREEPTPVHVPAPSVKATDTTVSILKSFSELFDRSLGRLKLKTLFSGVKIEQHCKGPMTTKISCYSSIHFSEWCTVSRVGIFVVTQFRNGI